jgi:hypothetical protein
MNTTDKKNGLATHDSQINAAFVTTEPITMTSNKGNDTDLTEEIPEEEIT